MVMHFLAVIRRQQRLQRRQVVALDDQVIVQARLLGDALAANRRQLVIRNPKMEVLHEHPAFEVQRSQRFTPLPRRDS